MHTLKAHCAAFHIPIHLWFPALRQLKLQLADFVSLFGGGKLQLKGCTCRIREQNCSGDL